jgi:HD domain
MALSLCLSFVGRTIWESRPGAGDLLFSELMLWGFLHRWYTVRRLESALDMLAPMAGAGTAVAGVSSLSRQAKSLERLVARVEKLDPYLHGHSRRVARHSWMIAKRMGLSRADVARVRTAAAIHDLGKIHTPKAILHKTGRLTDGEYEVIKRHPGDGADMASCLGDAELAAVVRHHHERIDGTGYPNGLRGDEIPLGARIVAVADTFDAITSTRPYRSASPHKRAIDILREESGTKLDPTVVRAFCAHYAGREPLALWSSIAGLPERALSWLGGGAASLTSAAKVVAVAALIGGAAATSSTVGVGLGKHRPPVSRVAGTPSLPSLASYPPAQGQRQAVASIPHRAREKHAARLASSRRVSAGGSSSGAGSPQTGLTAGVGAGGGSSDAGVYTTADVPAAADPARYTGATVGKSPDEQAAEDAGKTNVAGANAPQRPAAPGKSEEPHGKSEEPHGKSEEPHGKSEEPHGKSEEPHGKSEEPHGKSEEPHGKSEEAHGKSEEAHGKSEEAHGKSEEAHG